MYLLKVWLFFFISIFQIPALNWRKTKKTKQNTKKTKKQKTKKPKKISIHYSQSLTKNAAQTISICLFTAGYYTHSYARERFSKIKVELSGIRIKWFYHWQMFKYGKFIKESAKDIIYCNFNRS